MTTKKAPDQWRNAIVRYADEDPASLLANPQNWRTHPASQTAALKGSLGELGWIAPVIVNETTQHVVDGHARIGEAIARGEATVPVAYVQLTEDQERLALATFDPIGAMATTDQQMLDDLLSGLATDDGGLADLLESLASEQPKQLREDDADLTPPAEPITKPGDLWLLGEHRLLCGDSTKPESWAQVLGGERADVCLTDPPYGTGVDYGGFDDSAENVAALGKLWLPLARDNADTVVFSCGVTRQWLYPEPAWVMCWFFGGGQLCGPWGFSCWQPLLAYGADPSLHAGRGRRPDAFDLNVPAKAGDLDHPCPKPLPLWVALIERLSFKAQDVIVDCFGGAGTTLVAAEQTGRSARLIELSPAYCDVIVRRWEHLTGREAVRERAFIQANA